MRFPRSRSGVIRLRRFRNVWVFARIHFMRGRRSTQSADEAQSGPPFLMETVNLKLRHRSSLLLKVLSSLLHYAEKASEDYGLDTRTILVSLANAKWSAVRNI